MDPLRRIPLRQKLALARRLRREQTPAERHAWSLLRSRRLLGLKFRRQHVLHGFIVDFYCPELRLVLELEGSVHAAAGQAGYDAARTAWLRSAGYRVARIPNMDVTGRCLEAIIKQACRGSPLVPPLPEGEGDRG